MDAETNNNFSAEALRGAVEVALATLLLLVIAFALPWPLLWTRFSLPAPGPTVEVLAVLGLAFPMALVLHSLLGDQLVIVISRLMLGVIAIGVAVGGASFGVFLRELILTEKIKADYVAAAVLASALLFTAYWLWRQLSGNPWRIPALGVIGPAFVAAAVMSFMLIPFLADDWNQWAKQTHPELLLHPGNPNAHLLATLKDLAGVLDSLSGLLSAALATAATVFIVTSVSPDLSRIIDYLGLSRAQITAAQKLRKPLSDLVRETKPRDALFKREFIVTPQSFEREAPLESVIAGGARVKLIVPRVGATPDAFTFDRIRTLLDSAQIEIRDSLFFVYLSDRLASSEPVCYATGPEMWELMQRQVGDDDRPASGRFRGEFSDDFFASLNSGNGRAIQAVIENARAFALSNNPLDDLLLTSVVLKDTMEVKDALTVMRAHNLRRALVCSSKVPVERAVIGVPSIAAYLWADPQEVGAHA
ncbi:MAG: hypothetical protein KBA31_02455 [Alphaproteobacteria bacterium]|nr:hypothetical protein [Alphaproteobacteria bacterium]